MKYIVIFSSVLIAFIIIILGLVMSLYGLLSFFIVWQRNPHLNTIGYYFFFCSIPILTLGFYIIRKNWKYLTGKESWYK